MTAARQLIGRDQEITSLRRELDKDRPSLIVVYGRRRVGKSTLLTHVTRGRASVYYQATEVVGSMNLLLLKEAIAAALGESDPILSGIEHWESLLSYTAELAHHRIPGLTLILDEFPYICESVEGLPSIVQKVFDRVVAQGIRLNLVLCGSKISFMEELLGERNPLRGRQTLEIDVEPLPIRDAAGFFPNLSSIDQLAAYGVFGGLPYYLQLCDPTVSLAENIRELIFEPGAPLANEAFNVLRAELSSPARYATILQAIGTGCTTTGEIVGRTPEIGDGSTLAPYITKLESLRLIRVVRSLDASPRARNRRYYLADPFLAFWYHFCLPNISAIATGHAREVYEHAVRPAFDGYMGEIFEWIAHQYVARHGAERLGIPCREVGKIWGADYDIDIAATLLDGTVLFGECKWWSSPVGMNVLDDLRADAAKTTYGRNARRQFLIASKSGFTAELEAYARDEDSVHLATPEDLLGS
ncbi:MAG: restriction endonuclease [Bradymonadaceae bacterium]|nr:restriction endonuclease [Lujinxingiaceae bacterium]